MGELPNSCNVSPRTLSLGDGFDNGMHGEFIFRCLSENFGDSAASLLIDAIPELDQLQVQLAHINLLFRRVENSLDVTVLQNRSREIFHELQDAIDDYVLGSGLFSTSNVLGGFYKVLELKERHNLRLKIKGLGVRVETIAKSLEICVIKKVVADDELIKDLACKSSDLDEDVFVGRMEDFNKLRSSLLDVTDFSIVPILGDVGVGKTRLAKKLVSELGSKFHHVVWVNVSNRMARETFFLELWTRLTGQTQEMIMTLTPFKFSEQIRKFQRERKCLIVLDDLCSKDDWKSFQLAFDLLECRDSKSKLLVTTRMRLVAEAVSDHTLDSKCAIVHVLKALSEDESWEIIARKALNHGIQSCDSREQIGREIARKCNHIPLAINLIGEYLARKRSVSDWSVLNQNIVLDNRRGEKERDGIQQILTLIFMDLPVNLKHCLLYLAVFLGSSEIDTDKLYMLWIAEGLVQSRYGGSTETLIGIAERHLEELASRGLVEVERDEISRLRKLRSCRLNSMIRDTCLFIAKEENYLTVMDCKKLTSGLYKDFATTKVRKIAAHLGGDNGELEILSGHGKTEKIRSLLLIDTFPSQKNIFQEERLCMLKFKVLRVLHLDGLNFGAGKYPKQIQNLVFLRYLSFRNCYLENLPSTISKLLNLQTLDLRVRKGCSMTMPNVLTKMRRMKHLYLPQLFHMQNDEKLKLDSLKELETLENFNSKLCCAKDLLQLINLRLLTASVDKNRSDLHAITACISTSNYLCEASLDLISFETLPNGNQSDIQKLFLSKGLNKLHLDGYIIDLPMIACSTLSVVVFSNSNLDEDPMPMLGKLPNLRVLVFDSYAFTGKQMLCLKHSFHELVFLKLSTLNGLENLILQKGTMPKLSSLTIEECRNLLLRPHQLGCLKNLKKTNIRGTVYLFKGVVDYARSKNWTSNQSG